MKVAPVFFTNQTGIATLFHAMNESNDFESGTDTESSSLNLNLKERFQLREIFDEINLRSEYCIYRLDQHM
jgi:hypothetical protein